MALTIAQVSTPNAEMHEGQLMGLRARILDITFDSSYLTTGEVLTAASLGWTYLFGAVTLADPSVSNGTASVGCVVKKNTSGSQLTFQAQGNAASAAHTHTENTAAAYTQNAVTAAGGAVAAGTLRNAEMASTQDLSTFTGRFVVLGY